MRPCPFGPLRGRLSVHLAAKVIDEHLGGGRIGRQLAETLHQDGPVVGVGALWLAEGLALELSPDHEVVILVQADAEQFAAVSPAANIHACDAVFDGNRGVVNRVAHTRRDRSHPIEVRVKDAVGSGLAIVLHGRGTC